MQVVVPGYVPVQGGSNPLRMAHLAEYPAVRGGDALYGPDGAVGVSLDVHGGAALQIHVLGGNLPVLRQLLKQFRRAQEPPLPVGDRDADNLPHIPAGKPGRTVGGNPGTDNP